MTLGGSSGIQVETPGDGEHAQRLQERADKRSLRWLFVDAGAGSKAGWQTELISV